MLRKDKRMFLVAVYFSSILSFAVNAQTLSDPYVIIAPQCLLNNTEIDYRVLSVSRTLSLININQAHLKRLIAQKKNSPTTCGGFRDVTRAWAEFNLHNNLSKKNMKRFLSTYTYNEKSTFKPTRYHIKSQKTVNQLLLQLTPQSMWLDLITLTLFEDRYADSPTGVAASNWIAMEIQTIAKNNHRDDVSVYTIETGKRYKQHSVIAKVGNSSEPGIVIGAHMDTLSASNPQSKYSIKPGADDDGSGIVTVLEVARVLLASDLRFNKPIYFIWYAAEEAGLVGSDYVVADFKKKNIPISAVLQFDMTGYRHQNDPTMWLISDYVNKDLTAYLEALIATYIKQPVKYTRCGYACSDHATWTQNGYAAAIPAETAFQDTNHNIHTARDTMDKLSLAHMTHYAQLAIAFAVELAEVKL